jgi:FKBP-type peptidyl-prolyl cis-trans isomerase SlyD
MAIADSTVVSMEYTVKDKESGVVVDSNVGMNPLSFILGSGQVIPGLERAIKNMSQGETANLTVEAVDAYGEYKTELLEEVPREQFANIELVEGMKLYGQSEDGQTIQVIVQEFNDETVSIDYNHVLAGKALEFDIVILETRPATEQELSTGVVAAAAGGCCSSGGASEGGSCCGGEKHGEDHKCCGGEHHKHEDEHECCGNHGTGGGCGGS